MKVIAVAVLTVALAPAAWCADRWVSVRTPNFVVMTNGAETLARNTARTLEQFRLAYTVLFPGLRPAGTFRTHVVVFRDDASMRPYKPPVQGQAANLSALFQSGPESHYVLLTAADEVPRQILREIGQHIVRETMADPPLWLVEGIAELMSNIQVPNGDRQVRLGRSIDAHVQALRQPMMTLDGLFGITPRSTQYTDAARQAHFQAQSWSLLHYLAAGENGRHLPALVRMLSAVTDGRPAADGLRTSLNTTVSELERSLQQYVSRGSFSASNHDMGERLTVPARDLEVRPIDEGEALAWLSDFLARSGRMEPAAAAFRQALETSPANGSVQALVGVQRYREKRYREAVTFLKRAVETDPTNGMAHYHYAHVLERQGEEDSETADDDQRLDLARTHALKAIEAMPSHAESFALLSVINMRRGKDFGESVALLRRLLAAAPGRTPVALALAQSMLRAGLESDARPILQSLVARPLIDPVLRNQAQRSLDVLQDQNRGFIEIAPDRGTTTTTPAVNSLLPALGAPRPGRRPREPVIEALTPPPGQRPEGSSEVRGRITKLDCARGLTITLQVDGQTVQLHTDRPDTLQFANETNGGPETIECGAVPAPGMLAVIYYRPVAGEGFGEPLVVKFVLR